MPPSGMASDPADLRELRRAYQVLGVPVEAAAHSIKQEYRRRARQWHPDKWPAGSPAQEKAAVQMRELNGAYALIRHAPLRYHIESHPRVEARAARRGTPVVRETIHLDDRGEAVARFVMGAIPGGLLSLGLLWSGSTESVPVLVGIPIAAGVLSALLGDKFWHLLWELLFWW